MPKYSGETVEKAINAGLSALQIAKENATIEVIQEGKKGFLGFGKQEAIVVVEKIQATEVVADEVTKEEIIEDDVEQVVAEKEEVISEITELVDLTDDEAVTALAVYLTDITRDLGAPSMVKVSRAKGIITFNLETEKKGLLIGKHGKLINAIQYLSQVYIHRIAKNRLSIVVNVGDYRERRKAIIERLAKQTLRKVRETGQPVFLEPMPAFERKQVHSILSSESDISTHSEGNEPHRYLVVELKN
ncbi:RNA-binding cell elongation regulator Jag/EloR [Vagococcus fluvialis]|jgi:spoIIIJ-associated protein|uniref:RNA-binding protein KhpB n=1 Tax=Vagococcus fluvialis TaxID=2738 RepID=A0A369ASU3_9ENTE|nr:RNA-binding cell elongation regulator Jag/EloR [Vagococcus fluvialis]MDR2277069.1 protein jag [Vagococcus sp.]MBO0444570.1 protein jag [Vagococcus fluvialis]MBO0478813.1 protein jag [Vagococcus fluvialis]MBO0484174.1 protein jag [Vagococcus fluvialis]MDT2746981.1 RNA-binding cell elongation regulator Jag/EloR [Vagococcus fluvialis]